MFSLQNFHLEIPVELVPADTYHSIIITSSIHSMHASGMHMYSVSKGGKRIKE